MLDGTKEHLNVLDCWVVIKPALLMEYNSLFQETLDSKMDILRKSLEHVSK